MKNKQTYKTDHPTIKEISIGDRFLLNDGQIVTFVGYDSYNNMRYPFLMKDIDSVRYTFSKKLIYDIAFKPHPFNIKQRYIPLKDKIDLL